MTEPDQKMLDALARFARVEIDANDIEPWAATLASLRTSGAFADDEQAQWAVALYNTYDGFGSAFGVLDRWAGPMAWALSDDWHDVADFECTQERRNLRGGRVIKRFASHAALVGTDTQDAWLRRGIPGVVTYPEPMTTWRSGLLHAAMVSDGGVGGGGLLRGSDAVAFIARLAPITRYYGAVEADVQIDDDGSGGVLVS